jgi:hypothetical protein
MTRRAHLVGAWPGTAPEQAMDVALVQLGPYLDRLSDGETGDRSVWVTPILEQLRANPDVELIRDGGRTSYHDTPQWRVLPGHSLDPARLPLRYADHFERSYPAFKILRGRHGRPDLRFQVGIPAPVDLSVYSFGPAAFQNPALEDAYVTATGREIQAIGARAGDCDEVVFQIETVFALVAVAQADEDAQQAHARRMAGKLLRVVESADPGTHFGFHLCLGDYNHEAYGRTRDARPLVLLATAICELWPEGPALDYIHAPFAAAKEPPIEDPSWYEPLRDLKVPDDVRFIAGFLHESLELDGHRALLSRIEELVGRQVRRRNGLRACAAHVDGGGLQADARRIGAAPGGRLEM